MKTFNQVILACVIVMCTIGSILFWWCIGEIDVTLPPAQMLAFAKLLAIAAIINMAMVVGALALIPDGIVLRVTCFVQAGLVAAASLWTITPTAGWAEATGHVIVALFFVILPFFMTPVGNRKRSEG